MSFQLSKHLPALFIAFVFIQSLFFKFTGSYETDHIFGTLAEWSQSQEPRSSFLPLATLRHAHGHQCLKLIHWLQQDHY